MAAQTVVGVFDSNSDAQQAVQELVSQGFSRSDIQVTSNEAGTTSGLTGSTSTGTVSTGTTSTSTARTTEPYRDEGVFDSIGRFFSNLFGGDERNEQVGYYSEAVRRGGYVVAVNAESDAKVDQAREILESYGAIDIDERATQWRESGWTGAAGAAAGATANTLVGKEGTAGRDATFKVIQEELEVGKRTVQKGGVRVFSRISETPVEESVQLRDERAVVERRPVDRPATEADLANFKEGTVEVRETTEEPVIAKTARVVEEVVIGKEVSQRTETVSDTVRRTDVDVEQLGAGDASRTTRTTAFGDYDTEFRKDYQTRYGSQGGKYDDYEPAYRYGHTLAGDERYRGKDWSAIESDARRDWETRNPGSTWERFKAAVRHGWERTGNAVERAIPGDSDRDGR